MDIHKRWKVAKQNQLCHQCFDFSHLVQTCSRIETCGIDGCKEIHNRMLHGKQISVKMSSDEIRSLQTQLIQDQTTQLKTAVYHQRTWRKIVQSNRNQDNSRRRCRKKRDLTLL